MLMALGLPHQNTSLKLEYMEISWTMVEDPRFIHILFPSDQDEYIYIIIYRHTIHTYIHIYIYYILLDGRGSPSSAVLYAVSHTAVPPTEDSFT